MELPAPGVAAGLAAFQGDTHWYFLGVRRDGDGAQVFLEKKAGGDVEVVASQAIAGAKQLILHVEGNEGTYGFGFDAGDGKGVQWLVRDADGTILSTDVAGGFVGATLGPFARDEREQTGHAARDEREQTGHEARDEREQTGHEARDEREQARH
jgi:alpha-N-arabinofuranosidase